MSASEFAARLLENDGEGFAPATDPVDNVAAAADDKDKEDAKLRTLQKQILDMVQNAQTVDGLLRDLQRLVNDKGLPTIEPELAAAAESLDPYVFAASICEDARGFRRPSGRDSAAAFAAALLD